MGTRPNLRTGMNDRERPLTEGSVPIQMETMVPLVDDKQQR